MKSPIILLAPLLVCVGALVVPEPAEQQSTYKLHTEYTDPLTGKAYQLLVDGYLGEPISRIIPGNFTPSVHFLRHAELEQRDVCAKITDCAGQAASSALAWSAVGAAVVGNGCSAVAGALSDFLSANNYEQAKSLLANGVLGIAINLGTAPITYYINALMGTQDDGGSNDVCGDGNPSTYTGNAANAIYEFCLAIRSEKQNQATTNYDAGDSSSSTSESPHGKQGLAKFFVAQQAGQFAAVCSDYGITWKRMLQRGLNAISGVSQN